MDAVALCGGDNRRSHRAGGTAASDGLIMASDILIVDDEADIRELVAGILQDEGHGTRTAADSEQALAAVVARRPNLVFLDIGLQGSRLDGLQLLDILKQEHPELPIVMISGHGNIETAVSAIKRGAYDFIEKPFKADRLLLVAERTLENSRLKREVRELKQLGPLATTLVGHSPAANQLRQTVEKVGPTNSRVLIVGPSGSGKELAARTIHALSARADGPFVVINAAAIMPEQMEVELFGVEAGNGTQSRKVGALEEAHGGTLFIDEIADCGCWSIRRSSVSAAAPRSPSTSASFPPPAATSNPISRPENFARISIIGCRWCRSASPALPIAARTFPNSSNIS
jgi:two-component system nitrogen regulation response regulator NtrX